MRRNEILLWALVLVLPLGGLGLLRYYSPERNVVTVNIGSQIIADIGKKPKGEPITQRFILTNETGNSIDLESVQVSCGCTSATTLPSTIASQQSVPVEVLIDTGDRIGKQKFVVSVMTRGMAPTVLCVQVDLVYRFPDKVDLGRVLRGSKRGTELTMVPLAGEAPARISNLQFDQKVVDATYVNDVTGAKPPTIKIELQSDLLPGRLSKQIGVTYEIGRQQEHAWIPIEAWIERDVEVSVSKLEFDKVLRKGQNLREVSLHSPYGKAFRFLNLNTDPVDALIVTTETYSEGKTKLVLKLDPEKVRPYQVFSATINIDCDGRQLSLPIEGQVGPIYEN